jgi:RecA/RadA recombinase
MSVLSKIMSNKIVKANAFVDRPIQYINTGSLILNILYSGKLDGGIVKGKVMQIVAPSSLGKSFVAMKIARNAQKQGMEVLLVDTEFAYDPKFAASVGINQDAFGVIQTNSMEEIQQSLIATVQDLTQEEKDNLLIVIDSWGNMVTSKTVNDAIEGKDTTDMTISKKKNALARLLSGLKTTVFVVNQTYETMDQYNPLAVGGGKGLYFVCSSIVMGTSKAKDKDASGEVTGSIITATTKKGRFCKENSKLKFLIEHNGGIHPYYGILEDALEGAFVVKPNQGFYSRPCVVDDKKWREKQIWDNAEEFWMPIIKNTEFKKYISDKYTFTGEIADSDFDGSSLMDDDVHGDSEAFVGVTIEHFKD